MQKFSLLLIIVAVLSSCDGQLPTPITRFNVDVISFEEKDTDQSYTIVFTADAIAAEDLSIAYELQEKSATFADDLVEKTGTLEFAEGSDQASLEIVVKGDPYLELAESFDLLLYHDKTTRFTFNIEDNDSETVILEDGDGYYTPLEYPSMTSVWSDEFDGAEIDLTNWTHEVGEEWANNELQAYSADPLYSSISDGKLSITAREQNGNYTSARMISKDKFEVQYGRIDIRAKLPKGQGLWPALWMLGENINEVSWPQCGEIDIMELVGHEPNVTHGTAHYFNNGHQYKGTGKSLATGDFADKFHVFSLIWTRESLVWLLDGERFLTFQKEDIEGFPLNTPFFFIMNVAVGGDWPGNPDGTTVFPQTMEVDYVRVFQ